MDESILIQGATKGDAAAWEPLILTHQEPVFRLAYLFLGDPDDAKDITQETFLRAYHNLKRFDPTRPLRPWLLSITANLARNRHRSAVRYLAALTRSFRAEPTTSFEVELQAAQHQDAGQLWKAVRQLNTDDQQIIYLRFFLDLSTAEAAQALDVAEGTVKSRLNRAVSRLQAIAKEFQYPPAPYVADTVMSRIRRPVNRPQFNRQLTWALTLLIVLLAGLMSVPNVRAAVLEFIQIGIVRIFPAPVESPVPTTEAPLTATPAPTQSSLIPFLETLAGETTLESARKIVDFPIPLPTYPSELVQPDRVFLQDADGWMVILVWLDAGQADHVQMSLHLIEAGSWTIQKYHPVIVQETTVNGLRAIWTVGEYPLILSNGDAQFTRLIDGHVLIWEENRITYRLETKLELDEAIRIAESLQPPSTP